ncbi:hypothetical protein AJ78_01122 [Emergomyces pasteurianus Ep9510]|uniref:Amino acid permease/ SLC12A domain-containing protein n=1 Tax=Emergomyces pasteurianus Ep9510 TaxID=1447872 RepID=A0A1J9QFB5_9EURO|nr:hypothetical protein AJ78_01122 [Emergomyces pasteurianus Ep9510]
MDGIGSKDTGSKDTGSKDTGSKDTGSNSNDGTSDSDPVESLKDPEAAQKNVGSLHRRLKSRHIQFLALSGAIGTGLFIGSGQSLSLAGPLSMSLAYIITGLLLYAVINSIGEMATWLPLPGAAPVYASRYVDPALGFTMGWTYWYEFSMVVPIEITASAIIVDYWPNRVSTAVWITIFSIPLAIINFLPVRVYGEAEFAFGAVKLISIVGLILLMFIIDLGGAPTGDRIGFRHWINPGPMREYLETGALGRFLAFWKVFIFATLSYGGGEMVVIAAGEAENPRRNIPKAVRRVFWRITVFYVLSTFLIGLCVSSKDPRLMNALAQHDTLSAAASPFVIAAENGGISVLPHVINAVILISAWSSANSAYYASSRVLYAMALDGKAPRFFTLEKNGVPYACVGATGLISLLAYLNVTTSSEKVFFWIGNLLSTNTLVIWAVIGITYIRFYQGLKCQGIPRESIPYRAPFQPYLAYFAVLFSIMIALFNGFDAFFPGNFSLRTFLPPYINLPIFGCIFLGYKLIMGTKLVKVEEIDLLSGKEEIDQLEVLWETPKPRNILGGF